MKELPELTQILQVSISPVVVISSVGLILLSMTNRYGRAIDRVRSLHSRTEPSFDALSQSTKKQIVCLYDRCRLLQTAIALGVLSILLVSLTIVFLYCTQLFNWESSHLAILSFTAGMISLVVSLGFFIQDIRLSLKALKIELKGHFN